LERKAELKKKKKERLKHWWVFEGKKLKIL
jgi:hypothetical protein